MITVISMALAHHGRGLVDSLVISKISLLCERAIFYPRDAMLARVIVIATCPSVTRRYCVKTKKVSGIISSPSGSPKTLVF